MGFTAGDIVKDVYAYWNRPSEADLRQDDVLTVLNRKVNRLLLLAQLTDQNYLAVLSPAFSFGTERTRSINYDDLSSIVRVESRPMGSTTEDNWGEERIVDYGAWNDAVDGSVDSVAFYGSAPDQLTMAVNRNASNLEFRILYETGGVSLSAFGSAVPVLQSFSRSTIFYGSAADAGMMLDNLNAEAMIARDKKVQYALAQEEQAILDYKRWLLNTPGQAVAYREAFNSNRAGHGMPRMFAIDDPNNSGYFSQY